ncbi:hypothetical protein [Rickettsia endosymbiont of Orchestes rusci]|uniref:hypothetical protein n=1 Tax=Rickettsia endosymbiont of Orchestes rusci TaxID=3066250 RepID=UPI00313BB419
MKKQELLERFGEIYINFVYDSALHTFKSLIEQKARAPALLPLMRNLQNFNDEQIHIIKELVMEILGSSIHYTLFMLEEYQDEMQLTMQDDTGTPHSLIEISDGLCGELYTEDGWIEKYTKYPDWQQTIANKKRNNL